MQFQRKSLNCYPPRLKCVHCYPLRPEMSVKLSLSTLASLLVQCLSLLLFSLTLFSAHLHVFCDYLFGVSHLQLLSVDFTSKHSLRCYLFQFVSSQCTLVLRTSLNTSYVIRCWAGLGSERASRSLSEQVFRID